MLLLPSRWVCGLDSWQRGGYGGGSEVWWWPLPHSFRLLGENGSHGAVQFVGSGWRRQRSRQRHVCGRNVVGRQQRSTGSRGRLAGGHVIRGAEGELGTSGGYGAWTGGGGGGGGGWGAAGSAFKGARSRRRLQIPQLGRSTSHLVWPGSVQRSVVQRLADVLQGYAFAELRGGW